MADYGFQFVDGPEVKAGRGFLVTYTRNGRNAHMKFIPGTDIVAIQAHIEEYTRYGFGDFEVWTENTDGSDRQPYVKEPEQAVEEVTASPEQVAVEDAPAAPKSTLFQYVEVGDQDTIKVIVRHMPDDGAVYSGRDLRAAYAAYEQAASLQPACSVILYRLIDREWLQDRAHTWDRSDEYQKAWKRGQFNAAFERDYANEEADLEYARRMPGKHYAGGR